MRTARAPGVLIVAVLALCLGVDHWSEAVAAAGLPFIVVCADTKGEALPAFSKVARLAGR
jgi:hypothetical protein